jgi:ribose transport system permease protein
MTLSDSAVSQPTTEVRVPMQRATLKATLLSSRRRYNNIGILVLLIGLIAYFWSSNGRFATGDNVLAIVTSSAIVALVSLGQTCLIVGGGFDLSVGGAIPLGAVVFCKLSNSGVNTGLAIVITVVMVGVVMGVVNGVAIEKIGINSLIATLATLSITSGIANSLVDGLTIPLNHTGAAALADTHIGKVPDYIWLIALLYIVGAIVLGRTTIGRAIYAMGGNREAARLTGLRVERLTIGLYITSAAIGALAGVIEVSQLLAASPAQDTTTTLLSITAVILGGGSLLGGEGGAFGTLTGVLVLGILTNGLAINAVPTFYGDIVNGVVLLLAVGITALNLKRTSR